MHLVPTSLRAYQVVTEPMFVSRYLRSDRFQECADSGFTTQEPGNAPRWVACTWADDNHQLWLFGGFTSSVVQSASAVVRTSTTSQEHVLTVSTVTPDALDPPRSQIHSTPEDRDESSGEFSLGNSEGSEGAETLSSEPLNQSEAASKTNSTPVKNRGGVLTVTSTSETHDMSIQAVNTAMAEAGSCEKAVLPLLTSAFVLAGALLLGGWLVP